MNNFWARLQKPFFVLAPMADVTDAAFRRLIAKYSAPAEFVTYTEFVSADGLCLAPQEGRAKLMRDLTYAEAERPIVAQFFTCNPDHMEQAAALAQELGFDGVDINMGCPADAVVGQGAGAKLILDPARAQELVAAAKRGGPNIPVSVKTRLGYNQDTLEDWLPKLLEAEPAVVTLHARTKKEMSAVPARWERVKRAVEIRNELGSEVRIVGNGDVKNLEDAQQKAAESGTDGVMLGRAIFGNPWLFSRSQESQSIETRLRVAVEHTKLFEGLLGDVKNFALMKKHFKAYVEGFAGAKELRMQMMEAEDAAGVEKIVEEFLRQR